MGVVVVVVDGVRLCCCVHPPDCIWVRIHGGIIMTCVNRTTRRITCFSAIWIDQARTRVCAVTGRRITGWAMPRPITETRVSRASFSSPCPVRLLANELADLLCVGRGPYFGHHYSRSKLHLAQAKTFQSLFFFELLLLLLLLYFFRGGFMFVSGTEWMSPGTKDSIIHPSLISFCVRTAGCGADWSTK
jgi:hypothetical protein